MLFYNLLKIYLLELFQKRGLFVVNILFLIAGVSIPLIRSVYFLSNDSLFSFLITSRDMKIVLFSYLPLLLLFFYSFNYMDKNVYVYFRHKTRQSYCVHLIIKVVSLAIIYSSIYLLIIGINFLIVREKIVIWLLPSSSWLVITYFIVSLWLVTVAICIFAQILIYFVKNKAICIFSIYFFITIDQLLEKKYNFSLFWSKGLIFQEKDLFLTSISLMKLVFMVGIISILFSILNICLHRMDLYNGSD
ncbi:hypothetical protein EKA14_14885 [Bacillus mycoides]|nr:hypothetical protein EKA14_14885 [Bacillus mycoides]